MMTLTRPDAIDPRLVFRAYALVVGSAGMLVSGWGPMWLGLHLPGQPFGRAAEVRMWAGVAVAAACCAMALGRDRDPSARRSSLGWFVVAHAALAEGIILQRVVVLGAAFTHPLNLLLLTVPLLLLYVWATSDGELHELLPGRPPGASLTKEAAPTSAAILRSQYEQQIRDAASQEERHRLARELHDSIKQQIFVIQTAAATVQARMDRDQDGARAALDRVVTSAREAMAELEALLDQLRAVPLENNGLTAALQRQCEALGFRTGAEVVCHIESLPPNDVMPPGSQRALFRIAQEALTNIGRHARARRVQLSIVGSGSKVAMTIADDGQGFDTSRAPRGMGLSNMEARAAEYAGTVGIATEPDRGTTITVTLPTLDASTAELRSQARARAAWWSLLLFGGLFSLVVSGWVLSLPVATIAAVGVARNLRAYRTASRRRA